MNKTQARIKTLSITHIISGGPFSANTYHSCRIGNSASDIKLSYAYPLKSFAVIAKTLALFLVSLPYLPVLADNPRVKRVIEPPVFRHVYNPNTQGWDQVAPLSNGLPLHEKDRLKRMHTGTALISCPGGDQVFQSDDFKLVSTFCKATRAAPVKGTPGVQDNPTLPYLLEPRVGVVRGQTPLVRWKHVNGVSKYTITVYRLYRGGALAPLGDPIELNVNRVRLPASLGLKAGEEYQLVVEADKGKSSKDEIFSDLLKFGVLSNAEDQILEQELKKQVESRRARGVAPLELTLLKVFYLEQRDLFAEAFALLNQLESKQQSLRGQLELGRLACRQGLNTQAMIHFRKAAALASDVGDDESVSEAREGEEQARRFAKAASPSTTPATR